MKNKDKKNFIWNAIGLSAYSFVSLLLLIIVKLVNGIDTAGIFTYAFSISTLFFYISLYYNRAYQIANYNKENKFNHYFTTRLLTSIISLIIIIIFSIVSQFSMYKILIIILLMLFRTIDAISDCFYGYIQSKDNLYQVGISYTLKSVIGILVFFITNYFLNNLILSLMLLIFVNIIFLILYDIKCFSKLSNEKVKIDISNTKRILIDSMPIFFFSFLAMYLANCQKYVITYLCENDLQTIFGILIMPATVISLIGNYLIHPFINNLNNLRIEKKYKEFNKLTIKIISILLVFGIIAVIGAGIIGIYVLNFVYQIKLDKYRLDLIIIVFAAILYTISMVLSGVLTLLNVNKKQTYAYAISSIFATILCYLLARNNVINGSVVSYLLAGIVNLSLFLIIYIKEIKKIER